MSTVSRWRKSLPAAFLFHAVPLILLLMPWLCNATEPEGQAGGVTFEMHAVADRPGPHTREYLGLEPGADGKAERILLVEPPLLDSTAIRFVVLDYDAEDHPRIIITLTADGAKRFEKITEQSIGKQFGMVIGGQLYSTPRVLDVVHGGKIAISGSFTPREAANLVERLEAALPGKAAER